MARKVQRDPLDGSDRPAALQRLRAVVTAALLQAEPREVASLSRELRAVLAELDSLPNAETSTSDDLAARRRRRRATTTGPDLAGGDPVDERDRSGGTGG